MSLSRFYFFPEAQPHTWKKRHPVRHLADRLTTGRPSRAARGILRGMLWASVFWAVIIGGAVVWGIWRG